MHVHRHSTPDFYMGYLICTAAAAAAMPWGRERGRGGIGRRGKFKIYYFYMDMWVQIPPPAKKSSAGLQVAFPLLFKKKIWPVLLLCFFLGFKEFF